MAALIPEARAARSESVRLRSEMQVRKLAVRRSAAHTRKQLQTAEMALVRAQAREATLPSPWSSLRWSLDHRPLGGVLVPIP